jgi:TonB-linked SusC/RagA family outer membrane protein
MVKKQKVRMKFPSKLLSYCALCAGLLLMTTVSLQASDNNSVTSEQQQQKTVTGIVTDAKGEPVIGVSVTLAENSSVGSVTGIDGRYSLTIPSSSLSAAGNSLIFSYLGYQQVKTPVDKAVIDVTMLEDTHQLGEVVVTALGIKKEKKALGYSVQDLSAEELMKNKTANPLNSLQGKIAGVNITQSSGSAGAGAHIILRGGTSLSETRDNQPLFVVDGIIYDNSTSVVGNSAFDGMTSTATSNSNRIMDINPEDIENMSVLKGPAAAALYGSRAANGVIIITTKKGQEGATTVDFSSKYSSMWANRLPEQQSTYKRGAYGSDGVLDPRSYTYSSWGEKIGNEKIYDNIGDFFSNGSTFDNTVSVSTGTKYGSTYVSISRFDQEGIIPTTGYDKTTFRLNTEQKFGRLTLNAGAAYSQANTDKTLTSSALYGAGGNGTMSAVYRWARTDEMAHYLNDDGTKYRIYPDQELGNLTENPYWIINKNTMTDHTNRYTGNASANFKITNWWDVTYKAGIDNYTTGNYNLIAPGGEYSKSGYDKGMLSENIRDYQYLSHSLLTNFDYNITEDINVGALLGFSEEETKGESNYRMGVDFPIAELPTFSTITDANKKFSQSHSKERMRSYFGEFRASWRSVAYLTVTARNDKSSTLYSPIFGDQNASYWYPSVGGSFVFSEYWKPSYLSFGKVRASWAKVGKATDPYATNTSLWSYQEFLDGITGTSNGWTRGNPYLVPEMTESIELGLEMRFLNGRIGFDYAYYENNSYNQIVSPRTSQSSGYIFLSSNIGEIFNKGMELSISGTPIQTRDFSWNTVFNISGNRSTVGKIHESLPIMYVTSVQVGNAKAASFEDGNFMGISGSKWDRTEDGEIILDQWGMPTDAAKGATTFDIGNREPKFFGGFNNTFTYKNFSFNMLLDFRVGGDVYNGTEYWLTATGMAKRTENRESLTVSGVINTGTADNPVYEKKTFTFEADKTYPVSATTSQSGKYIIQSYWSDYYLRESANFITKTNWLRLRSISASYSLPKNLLDKSKVVKACTFTLTGTNLLLFTNYKGLDPESSVSGSGIGGSSSVGFDYNNVPALAGVSFGVNLKF